ncbi:MAG: ABC transporter permease [Myxococcales bacterium]|nr:ABC transporter permease [Myxococcales bacterium]
MSDETAAPAPPGSAGPPPSKRPKKAPEAGEEAPFSLVELADRGAKAALGPFAELGMLARTLYETIFWLLRPPYRFRLLVEQLEFIGVGSIFLVTLTGFFVGAVLGLQLVDGFRQFGAENQTGAVVGIAMAREMGPVFTALMVSSRAGSAMTTELGSMRVSDQINALVVLAVNPVQYLIVPRVLAGVIAVPILTVLFNVVGMTGAYLLCVEVLGIDPGIFLGRMQWLVDWPDVRQGLIKAAIFGGTVSLIACRQGFHATGGAAGVGRATNRSVVHNAIAILVLDYLITAIILGQGLF